MINSLNVPNTNNDDSASTCKDSQTKLRILIVDDDKNSGESLRDLVSYRGHNVTLLDEGMKFVNRMNEEQFDLIFMDYHTNDLHDLDLDLVSDEEDVSPKADRTINMMGYSESSDDESDSEEDEGDEGGEGSKVGHNGEDNTDGIHRTGNYKDEITGTYVANLARECYGMDIPIFAYTGDNSTEAIDDFKASDFKGVFVKPVNPALINDFFDIIEKEADIKVISSGGNSKLRRLGIRSKNFIFFKKARSGRVEVE